MKKRDIIIGKGVSGAYYADKFLPDNLPGYPGYHISKLGKVYSRWVSKVKGLPKKLSDLQISYIPKLFERGFSYRALIFLTEKLLLLQLRGGIFCILKNMDYDKK